MKKKETTKKTTPKVAKAKTTAKPVKKAKKEQVKVDTKTTSMETSKLKSMKFSYAKATLIVVLLGLLGLTVYATKNYFIVATVNGTPITRLDVIKEMEKQYGKDVTEGLISKKLVEQEASRKGVSVKSDDIQKELDSLKAQTLEQGYDWDQALKEQNLTEPILRDQLKYQLLVKGLLKDELTVTDDDVNTYIETNKAQLGDQEITDEIRQSIKDGLESQKASTVITPWIKKLKTEANVKYVIQY